jgi:hypothetical protein
MAGSPIETSVPTFCPMRAPRIPIHAIATIVGNISGTFARSRLLIGATI